jgi:two-component system response regulator YesN
MKNKNINVLIVEDDANIRSYLRNLINNSDTCFAVIAEADNGLSGAKLAKKILPDIIITDIFMPIMTGFEMLDELSEYNFEVLILSGYDDFQYLKLALKYGVTDYLLKPINECDLFSTLESMKKKLTGQPISLNADTIHFVRSHYIQDLFRSNTKNITPDIFMTLLTNTRGAYYAVCYIVPEPDFTGKLMADIAKQFTECDIIDFPPNGLFVIHNSTSIIDADMLYHKYLSLKNLKHIGISIPSAPHENVLTAIFDAFRCVEYQRVFNTLRCYKSSLIPERKISVNNLYENFNALYLHIDNNDITECINTIDILIADGFFYNDFTNFKLLIMRFLFHLENKYTTLFDTISNSIEIKIDKINDLVSLKQHMTEIIDTVINEKSNETQKYHKVVRDAISLIQENYATLTIEQAAESLFISPSYLMYLFKQDTGETFYNYIIDYRIQVACELLQKGQKIYEVSEMVGYKSVKFFSTIFKKRTGLTPSEYAKQNH